MIDDYASTAETGRSAATIRQRKLIVSGVKSLYVKIKELEEKLEEFNLTHSPRGDY